MSSLADAKQTSPIRRLTEGRQRWRVLVETWPECGEFLGRLLFRPDAVRAWDAARASSPLLRGATVADVVARAHDMPEEQLRRVLHSLA